MSSRGKIHPRNFKIKHCIHGYKCKYYNTGQLCYFWHEGDDIVYGLPEPLVIVPQTIVQSMPKHVVVSCGYGEECCRMGCGFKHATIHPLVRRCSKFIQNEVARSPDVGPNLDNYSAIMKDIASEIAPSAEGAPSAAVKEAHFAQDFGPIYDILATNGGKPIRVKSGATISTL